jgi:peptide/nickel transport system permease protein
MRRLAAWGRLHGAWLLCCALLGFCFLGPAVWRLDPFAIDTQLPLGPPGWAHPLGTDDLGRDELARSMQGGAATLSVALPAALIAFLLGLAYGVAAGLGPALLDRLLMRLLDAVLALPALVLLLCLAAMVPVSTPALIVLIGLTLWPALARLVRNEIFGARNSDFIHASRQLGAGPWHVARFHLVPVMASLLVVQATFLVGDSILALSSLSFLGLGVPPPRASWGGMLSAGLAVVDLGAWWLIVPPGLLIVASLFATAALGRRLIGRGGAA